MYLKKLEISGFKSFAQTTTLEFTPPRDGRFSITAIVGPNGSGKSNIADAIRWALGEQSLKQLRGKKSEDVIFSGSEGKGKLSLACVSMALDNSDNRAPIGYEELVITRRLYWDDESEYMINGNQVRLLDLQLLLAQAQFGHGSYGVIGQGTIDRLLLQTPAERKYFFDEAVGIKEFQLKRHHAYLKLVRTEENITQAERLLQEVEPHLKTLGRQVKKLEQRQATELQLRECQEEYYATLYHTFSVGISVSANEMTVLEKEYSRIHDELVAVQIELAALAHEASWESQFQKLQNDYQKLAQVKNEHERERSVLVGRLQIEYSKVGKHNVAWLENKVTNLRRQKNDLETEITLLKNRLEVDRDKLSKLQKESRECERHKIAIHTRRAEVEKKMFDTHDVQPDSGTGGLRSTQAVLEHKRELEGRVFGIVAELAEVDDIMKLAMEVAAGAHLSSIVVEDDRTAERGIAFLKDRQLGVATFLPLNKIRPRPVAQDINRYLNEPGVYGLAVDLARFDSCFADIFSYVFGSTLVVDSIATARRVGIGRVRMVTTDGDMLETSGSMKGGFRRRTSYGLHFSTAGSVMVIAETAEAYREELKRLEVELQAVENEERVKQQAVFLVQSQENAQTQKIELLEIRAQEILKELSALEQELSLYTLNPADYGAVMRELAQSKDTLTDNILEVEKKLEKLSSQMVDFQQDEERKRQRIFSLQDITQSVQEELNAISNKKSEIQMELVKLETRREDLDREIFTELKESSELLERKTYRFLSESEVEVAKIEIEKLKYKLSLIGGIDEEVMVEYEATKNKYDTLLTDLNDLKKAAEDVQELIVELDNIMKKKHAQAFSKIKKEFSRYFSILFEGGKAELIEVFGEEDEMCEPTNGMNLRTTNLENAKEITQRELETNEIGKEKKKEILTGIEVVACPPGKKIKNITALSGGERTLTSIALVCAILHTNPPPFVLFDEVEAALDEANTQRFSKILHELSTQSQFVLITHNRVTMHVADVLYGVTMGKDGVSRLLSVKLEEKV